MVWLEAELSLKPPYIDPEDPFIQSQHQRRHSFFTRIEAQRMWYQHRISGLKTPEAFPNQGAEYRYNTEACMAKNGVKVIIGQCKLSPSNCFRNLCLLDLNQLSLTSQYPFWISQRTSRYLPQSF